MAEIAAAERFLIREGGKAEVKAEYDTFRFKKGDVDDLKGIEYLVIHKNAAEFTGLNFFTDLKAVRYDGEKDIFGFEETVGWLTEKGFTSVDFLKRIATNQIAFRPITPKLIAFITPNMKPIHAYSSWREMLNGIIYALCPNEGYGFYRQDDSRQNAILCNAYSQLKRLEWAFYMGFCAHREEYPDETAAFYSEDMRLSPEQQIIYALALLGGYSYREFYSTTGERYCGIMADREEYLGTLRKEVRLKQGEELCDALRLLIGCGIITRENLHAAVDMMIKEDITDAAAVLLEYGGQQGLIAGEKKSGADLIDDEFDL